MYGELKGNVALQYLAWVSYPIILVVFASLFCHLVAPQAIGMYISSSSHSCFYFSIFFLFVSVLFTCTLLFWFSVQCHKSVRPFSLFCHLFLAIILYIQSLSRFCPQSTSTTRNTSNLPTLFPKCDHHGLVFSCFLSPLHATIVLIAFSCSLHQTRGYTAIFFHLQ